MNHSSTAQSALHTVYVTHGAVMELRGGWSVPARFGALDAEIAAARSAVAVGELCGTRVLDAVGEGVSELADRLGVGKVPAGAADALTLVGRGDVRWLRLTRRHARLIVIASDTAAHSALAAQETCLHVTDISSGLTTLALIGPRSPDLLARLVRLDLDPSAFVDHSVALTGAVGIPLQVLRWDRGPLLAYELTVGRDVAEYFWEALLHAGNGVEAQPLGMDAMARLDDGRA